MPCFASRIVLERTEILKRLIVLPKSKVFVLSDSEKNLKVIFGREERKFLSREEVKRSGKGSVKEVGKGKLV